MSATGRSARTAVGVGGSVVTVRAGGVATFPLSATAARSLVKWRRGKSQCYPSVRLGKRQDIYEERAIKMLDSVIDIDRENRDALPGSAVSLIKRARTIMVKRRPSAKSGSRYAH